MKKFVCILALALLVAMSNLPAQTLSELQAQAAFQVQLWSADGSIQYCDYLVISIINTVWISGNHGGCVSGLVSGNVGAFFMMAPFGQTPAIGGNANTTGFAPGSHFFLMDFTAKKWVLYHNDGAGMQLVNQGIIKYAAPPASVVFIAGPSSHTKK
ncbi:MAG: hypothetical protein ACE15B_14040 [Bryobacteraceae bacterium]